MNYIKVDSVRKLRELINSGKHNFFILLNFGERKIKRITLTNENNKFEVMNLIDNTTQILSENELLDKSFTDIGYAMQNGAFWCENF